MKWKLWFWALVAACSLAGFLIAPSVDAQSNDPGAAQVGQDPAVKQSIAEAFIAGKEGASGRAFDPRYRVAVLNKLASLPLDALNRLEVGSGGTGIQAYGSSGVDLVFVPVTPCRVIDTRSGSPIAAGATMNFVVAGACGVPFGPATAVAINFVAVTPAGPGNLRVTPFGTAMPVASVINYAAVPGLNIANGIDAKICDPSVSACAADITVQADVSATHLVADVFGYYELLPPAGRATALVLTSVTFNSARTRNFTAVSRPSTGLYCLTPVATIDPATSPVYITVDWSNSAGNSLAAFHRSAGVGCAAGQFAVLTFDFAGALSNNVAFEVFIP
jgi:hypothetical protein